MIACIAYYRDSGITHFRFLDLKNLNIKQWNIKCYTAIYRFLRCKLCKFCIMQILQLSCIYIHTCRGGWILYTLNSFMHLMYMYLQIFNGIGVRDPSCIQMNFMCLIMCNVAEVRNTRWRLKNRIYSKFSMFTRHYTRAIIETRV